jgi:hypothetical protein
MRTMTRYLLGWGGLVAIAFLNAGLREFAFTPFMGDDASHQLSTVTLIFFFVAYFWWLFRRWPPKSRGHAWEIGALWFVLTVGVEIGLGLATGVPPDEIIAQYNVLAGSLWPLVPLTVLLGPGVMQALNPER